jgi:hypothetical protein
MLTFESVLLLLGNICGMGGSGSGNHQRFAGFQPVNKRTSDAQSPKSKANPSIEIPISKLTNALFRVLVFVLRICFGFRASDFGFGASSSAIGFHELRA